MSRRNWLIISFLFIAGSLFFLWTENNMSQSFGHCIAYERQHQSTNNPNKKRFIVGRFFERQTVCTVVRLDHHAGSLAALAGIAVAFFTYTLWHTSRLQWNELKRSVDVSIRTARDDLRAYVDVEDIYFLYKGENRVDGEKREFTAIQRLRVTNYGKTPATNLTIWVNNTAYAIPPVGFIIPWTHDNPSFTPHFLGPSRRFGTRLENLPGLISFVNTDHFFTYGRIQYRDIYRRWWVEEFVYERIPPRTFRPYSDYNREKYAGTKRHPSI